jgi:hypothetical protein
MHLIFWVQENIKGIKVLKYTFIVKKYENAYLSMFQGRVVDISLQELIVVKVIQIYLMLFKL